MLILKQKHKILSTNLMINKPKKFIQLLTSTTKLVIAHNFTLLMYRL
ncbi:hypothetical protein THIOSC15_1980007 [uncultured Thiomicrorhabdus sp.]